MKLLFTLLIICIIICGLFYFLQEKLIFFPQKLDKDYKFSFDQKFQEVNIKAKDGKLLNALLFTADNSKGLVFYLHGNAGALDSWGYVSKTYTNLNYDVFIIDYRGYGKSEGSISSAAQLYNDLQVAYDEMKKRYSEDKIVVLGYSIATGPAAKLASENSPRLLILQSPYYSMADLAKKLYPVIPGFILKYKFQTYKYVTNCRMPVVVFHGDMDEIIYYGSSLKLQKVMKATDTLVTLQGQSHNGMTDNLQYKDALKKVLDDGAQ